MPVPHWGYVITGDAGRHLHGRSDERCVGGDLFDGCRATPSVSSEDAEVVLFSPQTEHNEALDHMIAKMAH